MRANTSTCCQFSVPMRCDSSSRLRRLSTGYTTCFTRSAGVVMVAARPTVVTDGNQFPASLETVISVGNSEQRPKGSGGSSRQSQDIYAPGQQIMVAVPNNSYGFRSGSSLAAAHVSGAVALLLAVSPDLTFSSILAFLRTSQYAEPTGTVSINACIILQLADPSRTCL